MAEKISNSRSFRDLYNALDEIGPIEFSDGKKYEPGYVKKIIDIVTSHKQRGFANARNPEEMKILKKLIELTREDKDPILMITREYNLRDKVKELIGER